MTKALQPDSAKGWVAERLSLSRFGELKGAS